MYVVTVIGFGTDNEKDGCGTLDKNKWFQQSFEEKPYEKKNVKSKVCKVK